MNIERQTYSDTEIDEYELKRTKFRKRKNSKSKNKDLIHPLIKKCKKCRKYMYNIHGGFCESCHSNDIRDEEIFKMYDLFDFIFAIIGVPLFFIIPYFIKINTDIFIYETYNTTIDYELSKLSVGTRETLTLTSLIVIPLLYAYVYQIVCCYIHMFLYNYLFRPILNYNYGYDEQIIKNAIKTKFRQPTLYS